MEHQSGGVDIYNQNMYTELQIKAIKYDHNTFVVQAIVATIVNYDHNAFIVQATGLSVEVNA